MRKRIRPIWTRLIVGCGSTLVLGGCGLSDQQIAQVWQSVITTALSSSVNVFVSALGQAATP